MPDIYANSPCFTTFQATPPLHGTAFGAYPDRFGATTEGGGGSFFEVTP